MGTARHARLIGISLALSSACASRAEAPPAVTPEPTPPAAQPAAVGFYSVEQAQRGRQVFERVCSECHSRSDFRGRDFESQWERQTAWELYSEISWTMPEESPGSLSNQMYADVVAYILQINRYAAGDTELAPNREAMSAVPLDPEVANKLKM